MSPIATTDSIAPESTLRQPADAAERRAPSVPVSAGADYASESARWQALRSRDPKADGHFVYSVRTTGVFCRPSCAARAARPENVAFHPSAEQAVRAGFRPCLRCRPTEPSRSQRDAALVARACRLIDSADPVPGLEALARAVELSPHHFHRLFKSVVGVTPRAYAQARRAERVRDRLPAAGTVTEALYDAGYQSNGRFYADAPRTLGMKPGQYRAGGAQTTIRFALGECSLGAILVAATDKGVCAISLGDDPERLLRELQDRFPNARLHGGDHDFEALVARVVGLVQAPSAAAGIAADLPLDIRGTAFQQRVWQALRDIPPGATVTYSDVAQRLGVPKAVRAVASACAANTLAVAIPCHRVVRRDGSLSGYRWGIERKRALLEIEAAG